MKKLMQKKEIMMTLVVAGIALPVQVSASTLQNSTTSLTVVEQTLSPIERQQVPQVMQQAQPPAPEYMPPSRITYQMEPVYENPENRGYKPAPQTLPGPLHQTQQVTAPEQQPQPAPPLMQRTTTNQTVIKTYKYNPDTGVKIDDSGQVVSHPQGGDVARAAGPKAFVTREIAPASGPVVDETPEPSGYKAYGVPMQDDSLMPTLR